MQEYTELKEQLKVLDKGWDNNPNNNQTLGASYIAVTIRGDWRKAKSLGCKKDSYWGWVLFDISTNSNGYSLYEEVGKLTKDFDDIKIYERQI